ncbi:MAG: hypothetical protein WCR21_12025 [Bacteroidota bacterium]
MRKCKSNTGVQNPLSTFDALMPIEPSEFWDAKFDGKLKAIRIGSEKKSLSLKMTLFSLLLLINVTFILVGISSQKNTQKADNSSKYKLIMNELLVIQNLTEH